MLKWQVDSSRKMILTIRNHSMVLPYDFLSRSGICWEYGAWTELSNYPSEINSAGVSRKEQSYHNGGMLLTYEKCACCR